MIPEKWSSGFRKKIMRRKEGSGAPKGALSNQCPRIADKCTQVCATHLLARRASPTLRDAPPFGAHACGTRHRLLPRWLSSRTGFPAAAAQQVFCLLRSNDAAVKHAPCRPVLVPVDRGPESRPSADWQFRPRGPRLAFAVTACRPERRPQQSEMNVAVTKTGTNVKEKVTPFLGTSNLKYLLHLVAEVIDHLDADAAALGAREGA